MADGGPGGTVTRRPGRRGRAATLRDVAAQAGVSVMTVSNVINGKFAAMTPETRRRIEQAIGALGYRPNAGARSLRSDRRLMIGLLIVDPSPTYLADPLTTNLVAGLSNFLSEQNYGLLIQGTPPDRLAMLSMLRHVVTDGICVVLSGPEPTRRAALECVAATGQPIVLFQEPALFPVKDLCVVRQDDRAGGRLLAETVAAGRPRRVLVLTSNWEWNALREREAGMRAVFDGIAGLTLSVVRCVDGDLADTVAQLSAHIAAHGLPDAIMAGNDQIGMAALKCLRQRGTRVPEDVVVTGFNAFAFAQFSDPELTTVRSRAYELGAQGGAALLARLAAGSFSTPEIVLPVELQIGASTLSNRGPGGTMRRRPASGAA